MLQPKKTKYRKAQKAKGATNGIEHRGATIAFGSFGLKAMEALWITDKQLEAARVALTRYMKREGQV
ncbi:MAG: 50S ribosomal protein L16, partial [Bacteroidota bacterium]